MAFLDKIKKYSNNASVAAIVTFVLTLIGSHIATEVRYHDAVTYNNINEYIENLMVTPGLVDEDVLSLETPFEQIEEIANIMSEQNTNYESSTKEISVQKESLETKLEETKAELEELKKQKLAELSSPELNILGENKDTTLKDYIATIEGHTYYLEGFLNTFLPDEISYREDVVKYGKDMPDKVNAVSEGLVHDVIGFEVYKGDKHFTMGNQDYSLGVESKRYNDGSLYISCEEGYSNLSFIPGHIDDSGTSSQTLTVFYLDVDGEFKETKSIEMNNNMPMDPVEVRIYNTKRVKITTTYSGAQYGLAEIYIIK